MLRNIKRRIFFAAWLFTAAVFIALLVLVVIATLFTGESIAKRVDEKLYKALNAFSYWMVKVLRLEEE